MKLVMDVEKELAKALQGMSREEFIVRFSPTEPEYTKTSNELMRKKKQKRKPCGVERTQVHDVIMLDRGNTEFLKRLCEKHHQRPGIVLNSLVTSARLGLPYQIQSGYSVALAASMAMKSLRESERASVHEYHASLSPKPIDQIHWMYRQRTHGVQVMCASAWFPKGMGIKYTTKKQNITCEECLEAGRTFYRDPDQRQKRWNETDHIKKGDAFVVDGYDGRGHILSDQPSPDDAILPSDLGIVDRY